MSNGQTVRAVEAEEQVGISPKVKLPAIVLGGLGVILVAASYLVDGLADLREVGFTLIAASPLGAVLGASAKPGTVITEDVR